MLFASFPLFPAVFLVFFSIFLFNVFQPFQRISTYFFTFSGLFSSLNRFFLRLFCSVVFSLYFLCLFLLYTCYQINSVLLFLSIAAQIIPVPNDFGIFKCCCCMCTTYFYTLEQCFSSNFHVMHENWLQFFLLFRIWFKIHNSLHKNMYYCNAFNRIAHRLY